jgi:4-hydroxy 2-oxovalerate aldolase
MHQITNNNIEDYCKGVDNSGVESVIVGHGNGLGASSIQVGKSLLSDDAMLSIAKKNLAYSKLGVFMIPGFGTILDNLKPAIEIGAEIFTIGSHITEANTAKQHIEFLVNNKKRVYGVLMMYHTATLSVVIDECKKMQDYGADGVFLMDSAGSSTPELVKSTISELVNTLSIEVGFHAHNNLGIAVSNSYIAIQEGATLIDGTISGFGAGAGNLQLESLIALLEKSDYVTGVNLKQLLNVSQNIMPTIMKTNVGIEPISIATGMNKVFSAFELPVLRLASELEIDPFELIEEIGKLNLVGGQEDIIIEIAERISKNGK